MPSRIYEPVKLFCSYCNIEFTRSADRVERSKTKIFYCGRDCQKAKRIENTRYYPCDNCGKMKKQTRSRYPRNKTGKFFCSRSCTSKYFIDNPGKGGNWGRFITGMIPPKKKIKTPCTVCGKPTSRLQCGVNCRKEQKLKDIDCKVQNCNGVGIGRTVLKSYLKRNRGKLCSLCGTTDWFGSEVPLVMDHINGVNNDDRLDNLRLVCGNCDMLLPTYKSRNWKSRRELKKSLGLETESVAKLGKAPV